MLVDPRHRVIAAKSTCRIRSVQRWQRIALLDGKIDSAQRLDLTFVELAGQSFGLEKRALAEDGFTRLSVRSAENLPAL